MTKVAAAAVRPVDEVANAMDRFHEQPLEGLHGSGEAISAAVKNQWIVDDEPHLRYVKKWCARRRAGETGGAVIELTGLGLDEHRFE